MAGSVIIGIVDTLAGYYIAPDLKEVVYFRIFLLIAAARPEQPVRRQIFVIKPESETCFPTFETDYVS